MRQPVTRIRQSKCFQRAVSVRRAESSVNAPGVKEQLKAQEQEVFQLRDDLAFLKDQITSQATAYLEGTWVWTGTPLN